MIGDQFHPECNKVKKKRNSFWTFKNSHKPVRRSARMWEVEIFLKKEKKPSPWPFSGVPVFLDQWKERRRRSEMTEAGWSAAQPHWTGPSVWSHNRTEPTHSYHSISCIKAKNMHRLHLCYLAAVMFFWPFDAFSAEMPRELMSAEKEEAQLLFWFVTFPGVRTRRWFHFSLKPRQMMSLLLFFLIACLWSKGWNAQMWCVDISSYTIYARHWERDSSLTSTKTNFNKIICQKKRPWFC